MVPIAYLIIVCHALRAHGVSSEDEVLLSDDPLSLRNLNAQQGHYHFQNPNGYGIHFHINNVYTPSIIENSSKSPSKIENVRHLEGSAGSRHQLNENVESTHNPDKKLPSVTNIIINNYYGAESYEKFKRQNSSNINSFSCPIIVTNETKNVQKTDHQLVSNPVAGEANSKLINKIDMSSGISKTNNENNSHSSTLHSNQYAKNTENKVLINCALNDGSTVPLLVNQNVQDKLNSAGVSKPNSLIFSNKSGLDALTSQTLLTFANNPVFLSVPPSTVDNRSSSDLQNNNYYKVPIKENVEFKNESVQSTNSHQQKVVENTSNSEPNIKCITQNIGNIEYNNDKERNFRKEVPYTQHIGEATPYKGNNREMSQKNDFSTQNTGNIAFNTQQTRINSSISNHTKPWQLSSSNNLNNISKQDKYLANAQSPLVGQQNNVKTEIGDSKHSQTVFSTNLVTPTTINNQNSNYSTDLKLPQNNISNSSSDIQQSNDKIIVDKDPFNLNNCGKTKATGAEDTLNLKKNENNSNISRKTMQLPNFNIFMDGKQQFISTKKEFLNKEIQDKEGKINEHNQDYINLPDGQSIHIKHFKSMLDEIAINPRDIRVLVVGGKSGPLINYFQNLNPSEVEHVLNNGVCQFQNGQIAQMKTVLTIIRFYSWILENCSKNLIFANPVNDRLIKYNTFLELVENLIRTNKIFVVHPNSNLVPYAACKHYLNQLPLEVKEKMQIDILGYRMSLLGFEKCMSGFRNSDCSK